MTTSKPSKELVRQVMQQHRAAKALPLSNEEIRRALGWKLIDNRAYCAR